MNMKYKDVGNPNYTLTSCRTRNHHDSIMNVGLNNINMKTASDFFKGGDTNRSINNIDLGKDATFEKKRIS
jgi:hypothetical protein